MFYKQPLSVVGLDYGRKVPDTEVGAHAGPKKAPTQPPPYAVAHSLGRILPHMGSTSTQAGLRPGVPEFEVLPGLVNDIKVFETARQAPKLHLDVGGLKKKAAASSVASSSARHGYHPYDSEYAARRSTRADHRPPAGGPTCCAVVEDRD